MLRITIELVPQGNEAERQVIAVGEIANDLTGADSSGNYVVRLGRHCVTTAEMPWREGHLIGFPRKLLGAWDLVLAALMSAIGDRLVTLKHTK